ncbi:MAG: N-acetylmuramoyl-L-alanine amidase [Alphaproteobacteria bacterium]|nr:N-acetylmuramoyl-L-alanine amidase [Alphaproteobacteria bacterium]
MTMIDRPSPNHNERRADGVRMLVLHYTGMRSAAEALRRMCDPQSQVSAHYMVDEDGSVYRLVPEERRAWHAGDSSWGDRSDVNSRSVGIELVNPGHEFGYRNFTEPQMEALVPLAQDIVGRHGIAPRDVLGHSDVAPQRKLDPGERFHWARLAKAGVGLWPFDAAAIGLPVGPTLARGAAGKEVAAAQDLLAQIGYAVPRTGVLDDETANVIRAFQRHFRPAGVSGNLDVETVGRLVTLVEHLGLV